MLYIPICNFTVIPDELPGKEVGEGSLLWIVIVKSDGFLSPPSSLITFFVTINIPCTWLFGGEDDVLFSADTLTISFCFSPTPFSASEKDNKLSLECAYTDVLKAIAIIEIVKIKITAEATASSFTNNITFTALYELFQPLQGCVTIRKKRLAAEDIALIISYIFMDSNAKRNNIVHLSLERKTYC